MSFTVNEYLDLVRLLNEQPEWRQELRRLLLTDELLELPAIVRELVEAQKQSEARLARLEQSVQELTEAQKRTEANLERMGQGMRELVEAHKRMSNDVGELKGWVLEARYRSHAFAYFGRWLRKARIVDPADLIAVDEALAMGQISDQEWEHLAALDMLVRGVLGKGSQAREAFLALEVSWIIDKVDVERAHQRASLLRRLGYPTIGGVGGKGIMAEAEERARTLGVVLVLEGNVLFWPPDDTLSGSEA